MKYIKLSIYAFLVIAWMGSCNNATDQKNVSGKDSIATGSDSLVYQDCYEQFFGSLLPIKDSNLLITLKSGNKVKFADFRSTDMDSKYSRYGLKSIDGDSIPELITYNYTGGAHCCDEVNVFAQEKGGYVFKARLFGGFVCIDPLTNVFTYSLNETLGYFFACYACGFSDSTKGFNTIREIELSYVNGTFQIKPYSDSTARQIIKNLEILRDHGYEDLGDDGMMDSGWRKEFVMNFAIWHYNNGKNWNETKKIFDKYYNFKDATRVWKEFYSTLKDGEKESSI